MLPVRASLRPYFALRPYPQDAVEKQVAMTRLGLPGMVQRLVMLPAVRRDEQSVVRAYRELAKRRQAPPPQGRRKLSRVMRAWRLLFAA